MMVFFFNSLIELLFPNRCEFCGSLLKGNRYICNICEMDLEYIKGLICKRCGSPMVQSYQLDSKDYKGNRIDNCFNCNRFDFSFDRNESLFIYEGMIKRLIHMYKFEKRWKLYSYFANLLVKYKNDYIKRFDYIVAVPLTRGRLKQRGYNQSSLIAEDISKKTGVLYLKKALYRIGYSKPQSSTTSLNNRYSNMKDKVIARKWISNKVKGKRILLFDDILTSGITSSVCANALYDTGSKYVALLTLARTLR